MRRRADRDVRLWRAACSLPWLLLSVMAARLAQATISYDVSAGVSATDNVRLTPTDTRSDTITTVGLELDLLEQRRYFDADVAANLNYLDYLKDSYSPGVIGNFLGDARVHIVQDRLTWDFADNFGQAQINPLQPVTPANRENLNYFTTGPDLTLPLGSVFEMLLDARYSNVKYQTSPLSSNRYSEGGGLRRELSPSSYVSFNVSDEEIHFDNGNINPDYDQQEAYFRYHGEGIRTKLDVELGVQRLQLPEGSTSLPMARAEATRQLSPFMSLIFTGGHEYSDAGDEFRLMQTLGGANLLTQAVQPTYSPFKNNYVTLEWKYTRERTGFGFQVGHFTMDYVAHSALSNALNEERTTFSANATRHLTTNLQADVLLSFERDDFEQALGNSNLLTGTVQLAWRAGRRISVVSEYDHARRQSELRTTQYQDNALWVKVRYGRIADVPTGSAVPRLPALPGESTH
jgi:hypothetical protein